MAERLRQAAGEGRLLVHELEQRLEAAFSARTYGQLDALLADLPGNRLTPRRRTAGALGPALTAALAVMALTAVAIVAIFIVTGVFAGWLLWVLCGWLFFARRRRHLCNGRRRSLDPPGARWSEGDRGGQWA